MGVRCTSWPATVTTRAARSTRRSPMAKTGSCGPLARSACRRATRIRAGSSSAPKGLVR